MAEDFSTALEFAPEWDDEPFAMVPTVWARMGLHWDDMGLLFWLRTHRKGFRFTETFMINATPGGRDKVRSILRRLEKAGLIKRRKDRDGAGRITGTTFIVLFPAMGTTSPRTEKPSVDADQGERNDSAGQTGDGFAADGKPVNGPRPAEIDHSTSHPSTENPSVDTDQDEHTTSPGQSIDGFSNDGKPNDGKSATKEDQLKEKSLQKEKPLLPAADPNSRAADGTEPDGSGSSRFSTEHHDEAVAVLRAAVDPAAAKRLTAAESARLVDQVAGLLAAGTPGRDLRTQLAPVTSPSTTHPAARLSKRLDEIATGGTNPLAAPARPAAAGVDAHADGTRRLAYRPCGDPYCTGGDGAGNGTARFRRRIDRETGRTDQLCDRLVTTRDGQTVTCHPDAALVTTGGA
jgi:hypothetical protein